ncbi:hypothetical protein RFI_14105 [Reticulomyxa filosa]|uniref:Uncharacterized protein n=1 Tax=Reticulomyxa filosa TaxID=46433 RepID=X6NAL9_RETFI|nr:hypothetical protein RFI_14105 [Reticulomyxa filosa]|eukprot:ETO23081.1 hypothetical protein RFI_14105 [Reticulomyxa filosa]
MMPVAASLSYVHPYVYPIHDLQDNECIVSENGRVLLPRTLELTKVKLDEKGIYVVETGRKIIICVGSHCEIEKFNQTFVTLQDVNDDRSGNVNQKITLREDFTEDVQDLGYRLSLLLDEIRFDQPIWLECEVLIRPDISSGAHLTIDQQRFLSLFIEDAARIRAGSKINENDNSKKSYPDFLVWIHKEIQRKWSVEDF